MEIKKEQNGTALILSLAGRLDAMTAPELDRAHPVPDGGGIESASVSSFLNGNASVFLRSPHFLGGGGSRKTCTAAQGVRGTMGQGMKML